MRLVRIQQLRFRRFPVQLRSLTFLLDVDERQASRNEFVLSETGTYGLGRCAELLFSAFHWTGYNNVLDYRLVSQTYCWRLQPTSRQRRTA